MISDRRLTGAIYAWSCADAPRVSFGRTERHILSEASWELLVVDDVRTDEIRALHLTMMPPDGAIDW